MFELGAERTWTSHCHTWSFDRAVSRPPAHDRGTQMRNGIPPRAADGAVRCGTRLAPPDPQWTTFPNSYSGACTEMRCMSRRCFPPRGRPPARQAPCPPSRPIGHGPRALPGVDGLPNGARIRRPTCWRVHLVRLTCSRFRPNLGYTLRSLQQGRGSESRFQIGRLWDNVPHCGPMAGSPAPAPARAGSSLSPASLFPYGPLLAKSMRGPAPPLRTPAFKPSISSRGRASNSTNEMRIVSSM